jgi:hypothetical protein
MICDVLDVWDNGMVTPHGMRLEERLRVSRANGAEKTVLMRWSHQGEIHEVPRGSEPLPDMSGVAVSPVDLRDSSSTLQSWFEVLNADGSFRLRIHPPNLPGAPMLLPQNATWIGYHTNLDGWPKPQTKMALAVQACYWLKSDNSAINGSYVLVLVEFDWGTGELKQWVPMPERY